MSDAQPQPPPPDLSLLPKGFTRWEYRGKDWTADDGPPVTYANTAFHDGGYVPYDIHTNEWPEGIGYYYQAL
jgi:hypothetical protein